MRAAPFLLLLCACAQEGPPPVAPVELSVPPLAQSAAMATTRCTARLSSREIKTARGCQLDERLTRGPGQLQFPCKGDGVVVAVFGEHQFEGAVEGGNVLLALKTELEWEDKCQWETQQELRGKLQVQEGRVRRSTLSWSYSEKAVRPGPDGTCYGACVAEADVVVE